MVLRILSVLVIFPSRVEPKLSMPIMHMFGSDQSLFIGPGNPRTSPLSGDQKGPYNTQDPGPRRPDWWVGPEVALTVYCCEQLLSLFCRSRNKPLFTNSRTWYFGCAFLQYDYRQNLRLHDTKINTSKKMKYHTESRSQDSHGLCDMSMTVSDFPRLLMLCSIGF